MNQTGKLELWTAVATAVLMMSTGCQSTGNVSPAITKTDPAPKAAEVAAAEELPAPTKPDLKTIYFEFDRWELKDDARSALKSDAQYLQASAEQAVVTVAGHCDERGSEEYNLALGDRRAAAVKRYLVDLGIPDSRVRTLSYGEERPAVAGSTEAAWSRNRRAELSLDSRQASR